MAERFVKECACFVEMRVCFVKTVCLFYRRACLFCRKVCLFLVTRSVRFQPKKPNRNFKKKHVLFLFLNQLIQFCKSQKLANGL